MTIACAAQVSALRELIAGILSEGQYPVPPRLLTLYVARKNDGAWLEDGDHVKGFLRGSIDSQYKMLSSWRLNDAKLFGLNAYLGEKVIHVLVERPTTESQDCGGVMGPFRVGAAAVLPAPRNLAALSHQEPNKFIREGIVLMRGESQNAPVDTWKSRGESTVKMRRWGTTPADLLGTDTASPS